MEKIKERTGLYHEHQEGALCGQHALNNLLQGPMFSADTLADIARGLDAEEKSVLIHALDQSENMDDTGFFNIQVLQLALKMFDIDLVPLASQDPIAQQARSRPENIQAYICNLGLHWFAIRRFGRQYFNLNSIYYVPTLILPQELSLTFKIIEENGYSVFIVNGKLPECLADQQLTTNPLSLAEFQLLTKDMPKMIIDGEVIGSATDGLKNGRATIQVPAELYREFQKNPNDPRVRQMLRERLPKGFTLEDIVDPDTCNNPHCPGHHPQKEKTTSVARMPERRIVQQSRGHEICPDCGRIHDHAMMPHPLEESFFDDPTTEEITEPISPRSQVITRQVTQIIMSDTDSVVSNAASPQRITTRRLLIMTSAPRRNPASTDDPDALQMNPSRPAIESEEELLLQEAMTRSLLNKKIKENEAELSRIQKENEAELSRIQKQRDELEQLLFDKAIAASLYTNAAEKALMEKSSEVIPITNMDSSSTSTTNSEPVTIKIPSSLTAASPSSTNTKSSSLTDAYSPPPSTPSSPPANIPLPPPTNTSLASRTNTLLPPSTATNASAPVPTSSSPPTATNASATVTTNSPPPTITTTNPSRSVRTNASTLVVTNSTPTTTTTSSSASVLTRSGSTESPTVEELRERRLQGYGNRDRSIISSQSNFDD